MKNNDTTISQMEDILAKQKAAHLRDGIPSAEKRIEWMDKGIDLLITHQDELCQAVADDFGHRSLDQTRMTDIAAGVSALKYAKKPCQKMDAP